MDNHFKYVYGPVESWRMGKSLGVDPLSDKEKICNLDCIYCQLGKTHQFSNDRHVYVETQEVLNEIQRVNGERLDYITFSGRGEPALAKNLGEMIRGVRLIRSEEIAVITNATLLHLPEVRRDLMMADLVIVKLDACDERSFAETDQGMSGVSFEKVIEGIKKFKAGYNGKLVLQIMFVKENILHAAAIAAIAREINPNEIQINTPLRPSAALPLGPEEIKEVKKFFAGMPATTVYEHHRKETIPMNAADTIKRHGNYKRQA